MPQAKMKEVLLLQTEMLSDLFGVLALNSLGFP